MASVQQTFAPISLLLFFLATTFQAPLAFAETESEGADFKLARYYGQKAEAAVRNEWERLRISFRENQQLLSLTRGHSTLGASLGYRYVVQPAYVESYHQRLDMYALRASFAHSPLVSFGLSAESQFTYSRLYKSKLEAVTAMLPLPSEMPTTAAKALAVMRPGDAVRIEVASDASIGKAFSSLAGAGYFSVGASVSKGTRFLTDVYRLEGDRVRVRVITSRNQGTLSDSVAVTPLANILGGVGFLKEIGQAIPFNVNLPRVLNKEIKCNPAEAQVSGTPGMEFPVETLMADYVINLAKPEIAAAYDELWTDLLSLQVSTHLSHLISVDKFYRSHWKFAAILDRRFVEDRNSPFAERGADRVFKGHTLTDFSSTTVGSSCLSLWDASSKVTHAATSLRSFDRADVPRDYLYVTTQSSLETGSLFKLYGENEHRSVNLLFEGHRTDPEDPGSIRPQRLTDLIIKHESEDRVLRLGEAEALKQKLTYLYPGVFESTDFSVLAPNNNGANAYVRAAFRFGPETFTTLERTPDIDVGGRLRDYIRNHPSLGWIMDRLESSDESIPHSKALFENELAENVMGLTALAEGTSPEEMAEILGGLRRSELFQQLAPGFLVSLLPEKSIKKASASVALSIGANDVPPIEFSIATSPTTVVYNSVDYLLSTINDRSFDLRVQIGSNGGIRRLGQRPLKTNIHCLGCQ